DGRRRATGREDRHGRLGPLPARPKLNWPTGLHSALPSKRTGRPRRALAPSDMGPPMGRIFETRKATMFARWNKMAKLFTRVSKDIAIAVKSGGTNPDSNPALRRAMQNARAANMPKDKVESALKRA